MLDTAQSRHRYSNYVGLCLPDLFEVAAIDMAQSNPNRYWSTMMNGYLVATVAPKSRIRHQDAISLLIDDHQKISMLFKDFSRLAKNKAIAAKTKIVYKICAELSQQMMIKEHIFYTRVQLVMHDDDLMNEAMIEHAGAKDLINQIRHLSPSQPLYDAVVVVLGVYVAHYFAEEESIMFPAIRNLKIDLKRLGTAILARKKLIRSELDEAEDVSDCLVLNAQRAEKIISFTQKNSSCY